jgi:hypothetical protein
MTAKPPAVKVPKAMQTIRLTYFSRVPRTLRKSDLKTILTTAQHNNKARGITGGLAVSQTHFVQSLEGERAAVSDLVARILGDSRHQDPVIVRCTDITARAFPDWSMLWMGSPEIAPADGGEAPPMEARGGEEIEALLLALRERAEQALREATLEIG